MEPKISVVLPAFNVELYVKEAVESILTQTFSDFELLIYNDGSTDKTHEIISSFKDNRIVYKRLENNEGYLNLLNDGLRTAKGKYIARMDADDIALPSRFEEQFQYLENNPDVGICGSWIEFIGKKSGVEKRPLTFEEIQYSLFFGCPLTHPTIMMRNDLLKKNNLLYKQEFYYAEDHYFFAEASFHFKIVNLPMVLLKYRIHASQIGSEKWREQFLVKSKIQAKLFAKAIISSNKDDLYWLFIFFYEKSIPDDRWLAQVNLYKKRIIEGNKERPVFAEDILERATHTLFEYKIKSNFYRYFYQKYYNIKKFNPILLVQFFKEKEKPQKYLGNKLTLFFIVKCLMGYRKKSILSE